MSQLHEQPQEITHRRAQFVHPQQIIPALDTVFGQRLYGTRPQPTSKRLYRAILKHVGNLTHPRVLALRGDFGAFVGGISRSVADRQQITEVHSVLRATDGGQVHLRDS